MKIRIISAHCIGGGRDVWPGDILDVTPAIANRKIKQGFAVLADPDAPVTDVPVAIALEAAAAPPVLEMPAEETPEPVAEEVAADPVVAEEPVVEAPAAPEPANGRNNRRNR